MFDFLNGVFLAAILLANIVLYSDQDFAFPAERDSVVAISMHREFWRSDGNGKCQYTGVMVPFTRDWPLTVKQGETELVLPHDPNRTVGHAFIINKKTCGGKTESVLRVGETNRVSGGFLYKHSFEAYDIFDMHQEDRPKWFAQVLARIERVAAKDMAAKAFIEFSKADLERAAMVGK